MESCGPIVHSVPARLIVAVKLRSLIRYQVFNSIELMHTLSQLSLAWASRQSSRAEGSAVDRTFKSSYLNQIRGPASPFNGVAVEHCLTLTRWIAGAPLERTVVLLLENQSSGPLQLTIGQRGTRTAAKLSVQSLQYVLPVSYTHLTLPTTGDV